MSKPTPFYLVPQLDGHGIACHSGGMLPTQIVIASGLMAGLFEALVAWRRAEYSQPRFGSVDRRQSPPFTARSN